MHWGEQFQWREKVHQKYHDIWDLKIVRKRLPFILRYLKDGETVLEIGAYNRALGERIKKYYPHILYKSMDIDPTYSHDYSSLEEIREKFDMVLLFEVIEHLDLNEGMEMISKIYQILSRGGRVIMSTPNIYTPGKYWEDASHRTAYHYEELGGILLAQGFHINAMYRNYSDAFHRYLFRVYVMAPLHRYLGIDFAKSIIIIAEKRRNKSR
jgi:SAM-dependent methyltransferase